jgi:hypothetical protein
MNALKIDIQKSAGCSLVKLVANEMKYCDLL